MVTRADDENLDDFEPEFLARGKRVYRDGRGPRVPMMLTDGQPPEWMRTLRRPVLDARQHQPHFADVTDASLKDARLAAHDAREAYIGRLTDAWRTMPGGPGGSPHTTAPGAPEPDDDDTMSPRDRYIAGLANAYRWTPGGDPTASANAVQSQYVSQLSPGARPGGGYGDAVVSRETMRDHRDAAETAYREMCARLSSAWRTK
jgi:hypothetical protein